MKTCAGQNQTGAVGAAQAQATSAILVFDMYCQQGIRDASGMYNEELDTPIYSLTL